MDQKKENTVLNKFETTTGKTKLTSSPQYLTIGAHYSCNAKCVFCLGGDFPPFNLQIYKELFEKQLGDVLKKADHIGICGFGEILLMPRISEFLDHLDSTLPETTKVFTTNGIALTKEISKRLVAGKYSILISLHASNAKLHAEITGTTKYDQIISNIKELLNLRREQRPDMETNLVFIVTTRNIDDLPAFVKKAGELGVTRVTCNYLTIFEPFHLKMTTFFDKERTNKRFAEALDVAKNVGIELGLPPLYGCSGKQGDVKKPVCHDPWNFFYVETQGSVNPCCYAGDHIGHIDVQSFDEIWNGPGYTALREGLVSGDTHFWCKHCMKHDNSNVDDIRSHITFRPETQNKILKYIADNKNEFPEIAQEFKL